MSNYKPSADHLPKYPANWQNLPTKAIRVPEKFITEILDYAHKLDLGVKDDLPVNYELNHLLNCDPQQVELTLKKLNLEQIELFYIILGYIVSALQKANSSPLPEERIEVLGKKIQVFFPYDEKKVQQAKWVASASWNGTKKCWEYDIDNLVEVVEQFPNFSVGEKVIEVLELREKQEEEAKFQEELKRKKFSSHVNKLNLNTTLANKFNLFTHQKEGVSWLLQKTKYLGEKGGILADQMGLGKTYTALVAASKLQEYQEVEIIVICPASLKSIWQKAAKDLSINIFVYSWAKIPPLEETNSFVLIADEAHYAQNLKSARTKKILNLADSANCIGAWLLTGTPLKNGRPINLFPLLKICGHSLANNFDYYRQHYCNTPGGYYFWDDSGAFNLEELKEKTSSVILRRTKEDCLDLPPKIRTLLQMEVSKIEKEEYKIAIEELRAKQQERLKNGEIKSVNNLLGDLAIIRHAGSKAKIPAAIEFCKSLLEQDSSIVVFTEFVDTAKSLSESLEGCCFTGETSLKERDAMIKKFQEGEINTFVGTIGAGGVGLTLTRANYVVLVDRPWTPGDVEQAEDRLHRIGQESSVHSYWLQLPFGIDTKIDNLLAQKKANINTVLGEQENDQDTSSEILAIAKSYLESNTI